MQLIDISVNDDVKAYAEARCELLSREYLKTTVHSLYGLNGVRADSAECVLGEGGPLIAEEYVLAVAVYRLAGALASANATGAIVGELTENYVKLLGERIRAYEGSLLESEVSR